MTLSLFYAPHTWPMLRSADPSRSCRWCEPLVPADLSLQRAQCLLTWSACGSSSPGLQKLITLACHRAAALAIPEEVIGSQTAGHSWVLPELQQVGLRVVGLLVAAVARHLNQAPSFGSSTSCAKISVGFRPMTHSLPKWPAAIRNQSVSPSYALLLGGGQLGDLLHG